MTEEERQRDYANLCIMQSCYEQGYNEAIKDVLKAWMESEDQQEFINAVKAMRKTCFDSSSSNPC